MTAILIIIILLVSVLTWKAKLLTGPGSISAAFVGTASLMAGGIPAIVLLLTFFVTSNALGYWHKKQKQSLGFEKGGTRDQWQVFANGGPALIGLLLSQTLDHGKTLESAGVACYAAGLASANADTWATEVGSAIGKNTISIITGKPIERGQSGGISAAGTGAAFCGSVLIALCWACLNSSHADKLRVVMIVTLAGFCGAVADSIFGATLQAQFIDPSGRTVERTEGAERLIHGLDWFKNDAVNFASGLVAVGIAVSAFWR